jgi:hypothetical protein
MQAYSRNGSIVPLVSEDCTVFVFTVKQFKKNSENEGTTILQNIRNHFPNDTLSHPRRLKSSTTLL